MSKSSVFTKNLILKKNPYLEEFNRWSKKFVAFAKMEGFKGIILGTQVRPNTLDADAREKYDELNEHGIAILLIDSNI